MANKQIDILQHGTMVQRLGSKTRAAIDTARRFADWPGVTHIRFWPEDFDAIAEELKSSGYRADGFRVGNLKAVRYEERA